uniref:Septin-7 n=1 Tax=Eptatretus burgeri TaxID=7764 RepID=A0A8C4WWI9_EPTBU
MGFANLPNQVHRKSVKKGFEFTLMVVGESGLGKSTLINSLFLTDLYKDRQLPPASERIRRTVQMEAKLVEMEERGVRLRLTVVDTPGFGDALDSTGNFQTILNYVDTQFEKYLHDESGLNRRHITDSRVHCCFYFLSPFGHGLRPLDVQLLLLLAPKVNVVPIIGKADALTAKERTRLKAKVIQELEKHSIRTYQMPEAEPDEDEAFKQQLRVMKASVPFAVIGAGDTVELRGRKAHGRSYPWGIAEVENQQHNDFLLLRAMLVTHMQDLQEVTHDSLYESFRSERLQQAARQSSPTLALPLALLAGKEGGGDADREKMLQEKEAELKRMQSVLAEMQRQMDRHKQSGHA